MEKELKEFAIQKDLKTFGKIYHLLFEELIYYPYSFLGDIDVAKDIVSDAFLKIWDYRSKLDENSNVKAFLITTIKNKCISLLRSKAYSGKISQKEKDHLLERLQSSNTPLDIIIFKDLLYLLKKAMAEMTEEKKEVFMLIKLKGHTYREVAEIKGLHIKTIEKYMKENLAIYRKYKLPEKNKKSNYKNNNGGSLSIISTLGLLLEPLFNFFLKKHRVTSK